MVRCAIEESQGTEKIDEVVSIADTVLALGTLEELVTRR